MTANSVKRNSTTAFNEYVPESVTGVSTCRYSSISSLLSLHFSRICFDILSLRVSNILLCSCKELSIKTIGGIQQSRSIRLDLRDGLSFILSHLEPPIWPRIISAGTATEKVLNETMTLNIFERYRVDCKINAYRSLRRQPPSLLSLHLNKKYLETVLRRIKKLLKGYPTVIDASQDTVDIYQPIQVPLLESMPILDWMCEMECAGQEIK